MPERKTKRADPPAEVTTVAAPPEIALATADASRSPFVLGEVFPFGAVARRADGSVVRPGEPVADGERITVGIVGDGAFVRLGFSLRAKMP